MQFVRKIIDSNLIQNLIILPEELKNKKLEMLLFPVTEDKNSNNFNPEDFTGVFNIKNIELKAAEIRDEWERI